MRELVSRMKIMCSTNQTWSGIVSPRDLRKEVVLFIMNR